MLTVVQLSPSSIYLHIFDWRGWWWNVKHCRWNFSRDLLGICFTIKHTTNSPDDALVVRNICIEILCVFYCETYTKYIPWKIYLQYATLDHLTMKFFSEIFPIKLSVLFIPFKVNLCLYFDHPQWLLKKYLVTISILIALRHIIPSWGKLDPLPGLSRKLGWENEAQRNLLNRAEGLRESLKALFGASLSPLKFPLSSFMISTVHISNLYLEYLKRPDGHARSPSASECTLLDAIF